MPRAEAAVGAGNSKQPSNKIAILVIATEPSDHSPDTQQSDSVTAVTASRLTALRVTALRVTASPVRDRSDRLCDHVLSLSRVDPDVNDREIAGYSIGLPFSY